MTDLSVASTILEQLGGRRFKILTGATHLVGNANSLSIKINGKVKAGKVNFVSITLDPSDTYTIQSEFVYRRGIEVIRRLRYHESGVYCDQLQDEFLKATGLYTRF